MNRILLRLAVLAKALDGGLQVLAALLLAAVPPAVITGAANAVISRDLVGDHNGTLAHHLSRAAYSLAEGRTFAVVFLLAHGLVKLGIAWALHRRMVAVYPAVCAALSLFVGYEVVRGIRTGSVGLFAFALLDTLVIAVIARAYLRERQPVQVP
ncbi:DUF2127 domain-containing protein [Actinokineospora sp. HUAS TT18]|uniref:DUF2127 domain-containing protein n=1 Tax=Actinokineospora sp. HUAS TT18 TaxID=3447451 RepID=UPI003F527A5D